MFTKYLPAFVFALFSAVSVAGPAIEHWTTDNGAGVYHVHAPELPMVDIKVVFNAGAARDGELPGLARMTSAMLDEGAAGMDADAIAEMFSRVGARYGASAERDMAVFSLRSLSEPELLETALNTFAAVLTQAEFPAASLERIRRQALTGLQAEKQSPSALASRAFHRALYGEHPYARMPAGDEDSVKRITRDDLQSYYQRYFVARNATVAIVGDIDRAQAQQVVSQLLAAMPAGEPAPALPEVPALTEAASVVIGHPSTQTTILMGQVGVSRDDPDYFPLYVGNHILGGSGLVSRLSDEIREKRGLSYSVYSFFRPMLREGPYQFGLQTRNDQAQQALEVMHDTLRQFVEQGPSEAELEAATQNITGGFALRIDSNSEIADYLAMMGFYGLPLDYLDRFNDRVDAVTVDAIRDAFTRRVNPDNMLTVLVGGETR